MLGKAKAVFVQFRFSFVEQGHCSESVILCKESGFIGIVLGAFFVLRALVVFFLCAALYSLLVGSAVTVSRSLFSVSLFDIRY